MAVRLWWQGPWLMRKNAQMQAAHSAAHESLVACAQCKTICSLRLSPSLSLSFYKRAPLPLSLCVCVCVWHVCVCVCVACLCVCVCGMCVCVCACVAWHVVIPLHVMNNCDP